MASNPVHEAVCKAAGWQAYCERCGAKMDRVPQLGGAASVCSVGACRADKAADEEARRRYWEEENA